jgi:hypothetical protein
LKISRFGVHVAVTTLISVFWDRTCCSLTRLFHYFRGITASIFRVKEKYGDKSGDSDLEVTEITQGSSESHSSFYTNTASSLSPVFFSTKKIGDSAVVISSSAPFSQTPSVYVLPLMSETKFHTHTEAQAKLSSCIF